MRIQIAGAGEKWKTPIGVCEIEDMELMKWSSGKVFIRYLLKDLLQELAIDMHRNIKDNYDNLVVIEGPEGSGKSNLAWNLCKAFDANFSVTENYIYSVEDFKDRLRAGHDIRATFWMDEGSNIANNRDWNTQDNKSFVEILEMMRSRGHTLIMCIPSHDRLDVYIREFRMKYLIKCEPMSFPAEGQKDRGYFELRKRTPYGKMEIVGYGKYTAIPKEEKIQYEKLKLESQEKKIKSVVDGDSPGAKYKQKYEESERDKKRILLQLYNSGMPKDALMQLFGYTSESTFFNSLTKAKKNEGLL